MTVRISAILLLLSVSHVACQQAANPIETSASPDLTPLPDGTTDDSAETSANDADLSWALIYFMNYDNDLAWAARPIVEALSDGLDSPAVAVVVFADLPDENGIIRFVLREGASIRAVRLRSEASGSVETLRSNLAWVRDELPADRYAVVFLNHGGRLDEVGFDEHPGEAGPAWLNLPAIADELTAFRLATQGELELVFFQQCGKGTLENYYQLRHSARYLMGSELAVRAPNGYYTAVMADLGRAPNIDGLGLALSILEHEPQSQFNSYSVIDAAVLPELPAQIDTLLNAVGQRSVVPESAWVYELASDEHFLDPDVFFAEVEGTQSALSSRVFNDWLTNRVVAAGRLSDEYTGPHTTSGVALFRPMSMEALQPYLSTYDIYRDTQLGEFWAESF